MKIAFLTPHLTFRGSCVALYDYAHYNETLLGNQSIVLTTREKPDWVHDDTSCAFQWMSRRFPIFFYNTVQDAENIMLLEKVDRVYVIKHGDQDDLVFEQIPTMVHCLFDVSVPQGDRMMAVSRSLAEKYNRPGQYVEHMVSMSPHCPIEDLRKPLGIPPGAIVFGRYGGMDTFNLPWIPTVVDAILQTRSDVYFLFMNTPRFIQHERVIFIDPITNQIFKQRFIKACDAMIVPETLGHTFGLAIGEFQTFHKPIICYDNQQLWNRGHLDILEKEAITFSTKQELFHILDNFYPYNAPNQYRYFTPFRVMQQFQEKFIL